VTSDLTKSNKAGSISFINLAVKSSLIAKVPRLLS
jgi:hypothetical protein